MSGSTVRASGEVKDIQDEWTEFDKTNNTGHFVPIEMPEVCKGQKVTLENRKSGKRTVTIDNDRILVQRLENLSGDTMPVKMGGEPLMTFDFSGVDKK